MASGESDPLTSSKDQELAALRKSRFNALRLITFFIGFIFSVVILLTLANEYFSSPAEDSRKIAALTASKLEWVQNYSQGYLEYRKWLVRHGTAIELALFESVSRALLINAARLGGAGLDGDQGASGFFTSLYIGAHTALIRISFLLLASWRLIFVVVLAAWLLGRGNLKQHTGLDILGMTSNGRPFFSGTKVGLTPSGKDGAPELLVAGLACPESKSTAEVESSKLGQILANYGAGSPTNHKLAGVILAHSHYPAYLTLPDEMPQLRQRHQGTTLLANTALLLSGILELHRIYNKEASSEGDELTDDSAELGSNLEVTLEEILERGAAAASEQRALTAQEYVDSVVACAHRVLRPAQRAQVTALQPATVATLILAMEAGKVLSFKSDGLQDGKSSWILKSAFPQLNSRAVLHSIPEFSQDYTTEERRDLRCAIIFASRQSPFGAVRFPIDLSACARALRQWAEVFLAAPHNLAAVADEAELYGVIHEINEVWTRAFTDGVTAANPQVLQGCYTAQSNLVFMPLGNITRAVTTAVDPETLQRLSELVFFVHHRQKAQGTQVELQLEQDPIKPTLRSYERIPAPFSHAQLQTLSSEHGLEVESVQAWSALRAVLNACGWLGRRVGDYTVPESSVIFLALQFESTQPGANSNGLLGCKGMVGLRSTKLEQRIGKGWRKRFTQAESASMAVDSKRYNEILSGKQSEPELEDSIAV